MYEQPIYEFISEKKFDLIVKITVYSDRIIINNQIHASILTKILTLGLYKMIEQVTGARTIYIKDITSIYLSKQYLAISFIGETASFFFGKGQIEQIEEIVAYLNMQLKI